MELFYFDESKPETGRDHFFLGGIIVPDSDLEIIETKMRDIQYELFKKKFLDSKAGNINKVLTGYEKEIELHGKNILNGKNECAHVKSSQCIQAFKDIADLLITQKILIRIVYFNHTQQEERPREVDGYHYYPLGFKLMLELFSVHLESNKQSGMVFGDYDSKENSEYCLSEFHSAKHFGSTRMNSDINIDRIKDNIYFSSSHRSYFLQLADIVVYLAQKFWKPTSQTSNEQKNSTKNSNEKQHLIREIGFIWQDIKSQTDVIIKKFEE